VRQKGAAYYRIPADVIAFCDTRSAKCSALSVGLGRLVARHLIDRRLLPWLTVGAC
jgi:hypothetical protein